MKRAIQYISLLGVAFWLIGMTGCSDDRLDNVSSKEGEKTLLNLYVGEIGEVSTRLAELGGPGNISGGENPSMGEDKKNIGLYIYYQDDYDDGDLSKPYIRNLECKVDSRKIVPVDGSDIYIYDRMTIVAFYPYNPDADDYVFKTKNDERKYPISEGNYARQYYIPYRAQANVNPTNAYYVELWLRPQQTVKIQVVLVNGTGDFPETDGKDGKVKLVPAIDPKLEAPSDTEGDNREYWVDTQDDFTPSPASSGKYVKRYNAYIWKNNDEKSENNPHHGDTSNHYDNTVKKGEILFQSDELTLFFPEDVNIQEGNVYRYGYNMETGELFIPTSEYIVHDASSLRADEASRTDYSGFQVCDIDLSDSEWTPIDLLGSKTYDGGGHAIKGLKIVAMPDDGNVGLFGRIAGGSSVKNIHLESPEITVSNVGSTDTCSVGALVGKLNEKLSEEDIKKLLADEIARLQMLGLPQTVIDALIAELEDDFKGGTSSIAGVKVSDPTIEITGDNIIAGGIVGSVGDEVDEFKGKIENSYVTGGTIKVNATDEDTKKTYDNAWVGAFAGWLINGNVSDSYVAETTAEAYVKIVTGTPPDEVITSEEVAKGFANKEADNTTASVSGCFADETDGLEGVTSFSGGWPAWGTSSEWPAVTSPADWGDMGVSPDKYPALIWETLLNVKK